MFQAVIELSSHLLLELNQRPFKCGVGHFNSSIDNMHVN